MIQSSSFVFQLFSKDTYDLVISTLKEIYQWMIQQEQNLNEVITNIAAITSTSYDDVDYETSDENGSTGNYSLHELFSSLSEGQIFA